jgi:hypothetical protein
VFVEVKKCDDRGGDQNRLKTFNAAIVEGPAEGVSWNAIGFKGRLRGSDVRNRIVVST